MKYSRKRRADAARKGWSTRRDRLTKLQLPDYGVNTIARVRAPGRMDVASELPIGVNSNAGLVADWTDEVFDFDADGHRKTRTCPPAIKAINKAAGRIAKLDWQVRGGNDARAEAFKRALEEAYGFASLIRWALWSIFEGVRFVQTKPAAARTGDMLVVPDWLEGGRLKEKAGGTIVYDGTRLVQIRQSSGRQHREEAELPLDDFIIFKPGASSSPEGDTTLGFAACNLATSWWNAFRNADKTSDIFALPIRFIQQRQKEIRSGRMTTSTQATEARVASAATSGKPLGMKDGDELKFLTAQVGGLTDLWMHLDKISGVFDQLVLFNTLTTATNDAQRTGNTTVHLAEEDVAVLSLAMDVIAEPLNKYFVPWFVRMNEGFAGLPPLADGETECYYWPSVPTMASSGDVDSEDDTDSMQEDDTSPELTQSVEDATRNLTMLAHAVSCGELPYEAAINLAGLQCRGLATSAIETTLNESARHYESCKPAGDVACNV